MTLRFVILFLQMRHFPYCIFQLPESPSIPLNQSASSSRIPSTPSALFANLQFSPDVGTTPLRTTTPPMTPVSNSAAMGPVSFGFPGTRLQAPIVPLSPTPIPHRSEVAPTTPHEWQDSISRRASGQHNNEALFLIAPDEKSVAEALIAQLIAYHGDGLDPVFPPGVQMRTFSFSDLVGGDRFWHV